MNTKGASTGCMPNHIRRTFTKIKLQIVILNSLILITPCEEVKVANKTKINRANTKARRPPTLLGIDRKIAYKCRKYHSG
jgi:hypothetical protein